MEINFSLRSSKKQDVILTEALAFVFCCVIINKRVNARIMTHIMDSSARALASETADKVADVRSDGGTTEREEF